VRLTRWRAETLRFGRGRDVAVRGSSDGGQAQGHRETGTLAGMATASDTGCQAKSAIVEAELDRIAHPRQPFLDVVDSSQADALTGPADGFRAVPAERQKAMRGTGWGRPRLMGRCRVSRRRTWARDKMLLAQLLVGTGRDALQIGMKMD